MEFVLDLPGGRLVGEVSGAGPAVVLLHAGVADRRMWNDLAPELARDRRVIRFDARGFGASPPSSGPYLAAADVLAVLDHLDVQTAQLVGASMGGYVALDTAVAAPARVSSLVLLASGLPGWDYGPEVREYWRAESQALARDDIDTVIELNLEFWVRGTGREWSPRLRAVADELRDPLRIIARNQADAEDLEQDPDRPARDVLPSIAIRTTVVIGENDAADFVRIGEHLASQLPEARLVRMADTAHLPALERPEQTLAILREHFTYAA